jgi:hypothetical protein
MWIQNIECQVYGGFGPVCRKEETVNWMITGSVVIHNFVRIQDGLVSDMGKCFAVSHTAFTILDEDGSD